MEIAEVIATLTAGAKIVGSAIEPHGFLWVPGAIHEGHPGNAAGGAFVRSDRRLELGFRWSLGPVIYRIGTASVNHEALMRHLGHHAVAAYPGYSAIPLDAFRHLAIDLQAFCGDFMFGNGATIIAASNTPSIGGFRALRDS